jgi:hypothetical protein
MKVEFFKSTNSFPIASHGDLLKTLLKKHAHNSQTIKVELYAIQEIAQDIKDEWEWIQKKAAYFDESTTTIITKLLNQQQKINRIAKRFKIKEEPGFGDVQYLNIAAKWIRFEKDLKFSLKTLQNAIENMKQLSPQQTKLSSDKYWIIEKQKESWTERQPSNKGKAKHDITIEMPLTISSGINMVAISGNGQGSIRKYFTFWQYKKDRWVNIK